jgi:hypothetical protein
MKTILVEAGETFFLSLETELATAEKSDNGLVFK